jgi:hypothetical protein
MFSILVGQGGIYLEVLSRHVPNPLEGCTMQRHVYSLVGWSRPKPLALNSALGSNMCTHWLVGVGLSP